MGIAERVFSGFFIKLNRRIYWHQLPFPFAFLNLVALRNNLRRKNLYDTTPVEPPAPAIDDFGMDVRRYRAPDGSYNDPVHPCMGMKGTRFGRNVASWRHQLNLAALMDPNPRTISRRLMTRHAFQPATSLNLLAAAWLQFQVHDWLDHGTNSLEHKHSIPLDENDDWPLTQMLVPATLPDPTSNPSNADIPTTFLSHSTHWWDSSQLYGDSLEQQHGLRGVGGKLKLTDDERLPLDENGLDLTGNNNNWWIGLSLVHTLFAREHNAICDMLSAAYPKWSDDRLFHTARLIVAALIAKIHTIEWTPTLLDTTLLHIAMRGNWWGILGEAIRKRYGRVSSGDILSGIMGSRPDHHGTPYAMTEEFTAVYRMHPLIPDDFLIRDVLHGGVSKQASLVDVSGKNTRKIIDEVGMGNILFHLGTAHPGALRLRNYPKGLQQLLRQDNQGLTDLAAVEILRDRERGVPRYNDFREQLDMPRIKRFEDLTDDQELAIEIQSVYNGDLDKVDTLVGVLAETPPPGFAFSDTAFRIFILMASRRLKSDRFFTTEFTPDIYSEEGMRWVQDTTFTDVLLRHFPEMEPALLSGKSPFTPWVGGPR
jgi:hypothetical protein